MFYCLTGRAFRHECQKILCDAWALKGFHISCASHLDSDKEAPHYHQQMIPNDRNRMIIPQRQRQRMKRSYL